VSESFDGAMLCFVIFCHVLLCEFGKRIVARSSKPANLTKGNAESSKQILSRSAMEEGLGGGVAPPICDLTSYRVKYAKNYFRPVKPGDFNGFGQKTGHVTLL